MFYPSEEVFYFNTDTLQTAREAPESYEEEQDLAFTGRMRVADKVRQQVSQWSRKVVLLQLQAAGLDLSRIASLTDNDYWGFGSGDGATILLWAESAQAAAVLAYAINKVCNKTQDIDQMANDPEALSFVKEISEVSSVREGAEAGGEVNRA